MATRNTEKQIFEKALAQAREEDQAGEKARSMLAAPELKNALEELKRDAPNDQPFVRGIGKLREVKDPAASDRQEQVVAEHPQANPVGEAPLSGESRAKVVVRPRPDPKAHVTSPSIAKREELGLLAPVQAAGKSAAGTVRLKLEGSELPYGGVDTAPAPPKHASFWPWLVLVVVLLIGIAALASWGLNSGEQTKTPSARPSGASSVVVSATASAVESTPNGSATPSAIPSDSSAQDSSEPANSASKPSSAEIRTSPSSSAVTASSPAATPSSGAVSVPTPPSSLPTPVTTPRTSAPTTSAKPSSDRLPD